MDNNSFNSENLKKEFILESMGYKKDERNSYVKVQENGIVYVKMITGLIIKIDKDNFTAYRLDEEKKEWQEDSILYTDYEYGELEGEEIELEENYPYGSPYVFDGKSK